LDKAYDRGPTIRSRELRNNPTESERLLWDKLRSRQLLGVRFNRQVPIGPYIADFVSRSEKLIIELDGGQHAWQVERDRKRTHYLEALGYRVIRFWNNEVIENIEGAVSVIERALRDNPSPSPSREREGDE